MRIIVHFGMQKTGSSSIQHTIYQNRADLPNIYYPDIGIPNHSVFVWSQFCGRNANKKKANINSKLFQRRKKNKLAMFETSLGSSEGRDILISAEVLGAFSFDDLKSLHTLLSNYTNEVIAVGYIRTPKALFDSAFQQTLKSGSVKNRFLPKRSGTYQARFEKFDQIFGKENVYFWKFDPASFPDGCVVKDFCQRLNIDISPDSIIRVNEGLSLPAVSLLYTYLKYGKKLILDSVGEKKYPKLVRLLQQIQGKKFRFASEVIAPRLDRQQIEWMETRMGESLAEDICNGEDAIYSEADLLTFAPETTHWLAEQLGDDYVKLWHPQMSVEEIAEWMHVLRLRTCQ